MMVDDTRRKTLHDFISTVCEPGSVIYTDGYRNYKGLEGLGYKHVATNISKSEQEAHELMPGVHRVASLLKRWLLGTHQGGFQRQHLDYYLDEFTFRFNRRRSSHPGLLFYRLISQAITTRPITYDTIVWSRAGRRKPPETTVEDTANADEPLDFLPADNDEAIPF